MGKNSCEALVVCCSLLIHREGLGRSFEKNFSGERIAFVFNTFYFRLWFSYQNNFYLRRILHCR